MQTFTFNPALLGLDDVIASFNKGANSINELKSVLGHKFVTNMKQIYFLLKLRFRENSIQFPKIEIAQTDKTLAQIGDQGRISRLIKKCKDIHLLHPLKNGEGKEGYKVGKRGKTYYVNKPLAKIILDFGDLNQFPVPIFHTHKSEIEEVKEKAKSDTVEAESTQSAAIDLSLLDGLKLGNYKGIKAAQLAQFSDEQLIDAVQKTYKQLSMIQSYNDKFNAANTYPELDRTCKVKIKRGERALKISCRDYSGICKMVNSEGENLEANSRQDFFISYFGKSDVAEYDLKSSIYRINSFVNSGNWAAPSHDFYADLSPTYAKKYRKIVKKAAMYCYFSDMSNKQIAHQLRQEFGHIKERKELDELEEAILGTAGMLEDTPFINFFGEPLTIGGADVQEYEVDVIAAIVDDIKANMQNAIGEILGSEVFLHESAIMSMLYNYLIKRYGKAVCVYDCVYCDCAQDELNEVCNKMLDKIATFYKEKFLTK